MSSFITIGFENTDEYQSLLELESLYEKEILKALKEQYDYVFQDTSSISIILENFSSSDNLLSDVLNKAILAYTLLGAAYGSELISKLIPNFSYEGQKDELQSWANNKARESLQLINKTSKKRLDNALLSYSLGSISLEQLKEQYNAIAVEDRARLINETESIIAFNMGTLILSRAVKFVIAFKWITVGDEKVCMLCKPRHGVVYPINSVPLPPLHHFCRCRLAVVIDKRRVVNEFLGF